MRAKRLYEAKLLLSSPWISPGGEGPGAVMQDHMAHWWQYATWRESRETIGFFRHTMTTAAIG